MSAEALEDTGPENWTWNGKGDITDFTLSILWGESKEKSLLTKKKGSKIVDCLASIKGRRKWM